MTGRVFLGLLLVAAIGCGDRRDPAPAGETGLSDPGLDDGGDSGSSGSDTGDAAEPADLPPPPDVQPAPGGIRRLRADQYKKSIEVLLGLEAAAEATPPVDQALGGFDSIGAVQLALSPIAVEQYERSAIAVAAAAIKHPDTLARSVPCIDSGPHDNACLDAVVRDFGAVAWRRALTDDEAATILVIAQEARAWAGGDFWRGVQYAIATILQSPELIYIVELGEGDDGEFGRRLTDRELVTRMALFALGRVPDAELLARADAGDLKTDDGRLALARELVEHPDARPALLRFFDELLRVRELPLRAKDPTLFPNYSSALAESMRGEALLIVNEIVLSKDASYLDLFDADFTYVDPLLAEHYGIPAPATPAFERVDLPPGQGRIGLLGTASFAALFSHPDRTSPTRRGVFVQRTLLCNEVPPPPPDLDTNLPEPTEETTLRARMEAHVAKAECAACHNMTDPIGFAFESFDATGAYRTLDNGFPIDTTGDVEAIGVFANAAELALALREHPGLATCLAKNLYRHSIGHVDGPEQAEAMAWLAEAFVRSDHAVKELVVQLMTNPVFLRVDGAK